MQPDDEVATVVVLFHQRALLLEVHVSRRPHYGPWLVALRERLGYQRTGIEYQVGLLQHPAATDGDEVRVAGAGTDNLDVGIGLARTYTDFFLFLCKFVFVRC